ncbi:MAG TPA: WD40 repeat domain-containing serine/threonine-protein kinase [Pirellulaceae bacterium]|nr:WD40 repeat domain-containing serine/threonine-protein kinase [Pirellulaceae bacterium]
MIDSRGHDPDELAADAEAYEAASPLGSTVGSGFEIEHPGLAKTLRMLQAVFLSPPEPDDSDTGSKCLELSTIGRFQVNRCLGSGNFGSVWLANDPVLKRDVAVKVAHVGAHARVDLQQRFEREAHLAARLHHPNIVPVFESGVDEGRLFIVSEYCDGPSLAEWLAKRNQPVEATLAANLIQQLADAAEHAHRQGLIHRDIKPANVLLAGRGFDGDKPELVPRLTDFGLARDLTIETSTTRAGVMLGTAEYMSPEQALGRVDAHGPASDVFSLGVLLYCLLTGQTPFSGKTDFEVIQQTTMAVPVAPARLCRTVPQDLNSICLKCIEKQPERRYTTAAELRDDLESFLRGESTVARPIGAVERIGRWSRRAPATAALVFISLASFAAIVFGLGFHLRQEKQHTRELAMLLQETRQQRENAGHAQDDAEKHRQLARETSYRSEMRLAFDLWPRGQIHRVQEILERQLPQDSVDLRGPEWFVLEADFRAKYRQIGQHEGAVTECRLSGDQQLAFTAGTDGYVRVWDVSSGNELVAFCPQIGEIHALAISPDEKTIAVGGEPLLPEDVCHVALIDAGTGELRRQLQTHETTIESIAFSEDGRWMAAGSRYEPVQLTRLPDETTFTLPANRRNRTLSFSHDSQSLVVAADESHFAVWGLAGSEPERLHSLTGANGRDPYVSAFAPGVPLVAAGYQSPNYVALFDVSAQALRGMAFGNSSNPIAKTTALAFSPDAQLLSVGDASGKILLWEAGGKEMIRDKVDWHTTQQGLEPIVSWTPHLARVTSISMTDRGAVISSGEDGRIAASTPFATGVRHVRWKGIQVNAAVLDGGELLLACEDGTIRRHVVDDSTKGALHAAAETVQPIETPETITRHSNSIQCLAVSPDGKVLAVGTIRGGLRLYRRATGEFIRSLVDETSAGDTAVRAVAFSSNGRLLAHTGRAGFVTVHDMASGKTKLKRKIGNGLTVKFLANDRFLACGGQFENVQFFDLDTGILAHSVVSVDTHSLALSPDDRWLASTHTPGTVHLLDAGFERPPPISRGRFWSGESAAFSVDGRTVISVDNFCALRFADVRTGQAFGVLKLPDRPTPAFIRNPQVHCGEKVLAVTGYGVGPVSDLYLWNLEPLVR